MDTKELSVSDYQKFAELNLGYVFEEPKYLIEALTHSSYANEKNKTVNDNERLEFLGDAVLEAVISEALYLDTNNFDEGKMSKIRSLTVREESLVEVANRLGLSEYLRLGLGEDKSGGRYKPSNLEDATEAVIGAIFMDGGLEPAKAFILKNLSSTLEAAKSGNLIYDYKSRLYQVLQAEEEEPEVEFRLIDESGPAHAKSFTIEVVYKGKAYTPACSNSKKSAEQAAAKNFLAEYKN